MKFRTTRENLAKAVGIAGRLTSNRSTLPILQNILLIASKTKLVVQATNLEQTIETEVVGDGEEVGKLTVPARLFGDYLQSNADKEILIEGDDTTLKISSLNHKAQIKGLPAEEYPSVPQAKGESSVELPTSKIVEAISRCIIASAQDDSRPILNSLLWRFKGKNLVVVGTDGYRLASCEIALNQETEGDFILPRRTMAVLSGDVQIGLNDAKSPIVVRPTGGEKMLYLLMPLRSD